MDIIDKLFYSFAGTFLAFLITAIGCHVTHNDNEIWLPIAVASVVGLCFVNRFAHSAWHVDVKERDRE